MDGALEDVTVLDLTTHVVGPYATRLLGDLGANVIKVEDADGDPSRRLGPFKDNDSSIEKSGTFFYFNTNKRSVVLDLKTEAGREVLWKLIAVADVVVESMAPGYLEKMGFGWEAIHRSKPALSMVSVSNFGATGPYKDYKGGELVLYGFGGEMHSTGRLDREPVKMYGTAALVLSGSALSTAIMGALFSGRFQRQGQYVDFSIADSHLVGVDRRHATVMGEQFSGRKSLRAEATAAVGILQGLYECADGWIDIGGGGPRFANVREFLGHPDWIMDDKWSNPAIQYDPSAVEEFNQHFSIWLKAHTKNEIWEAGRKAKFLCGPLFTIEEVFEDKNFQERGVWEEASTEAMGDFVFPGRPFLMSETPWKYRLPAPVLGQHTREVLEEVGCDDATIDTLIDTKFVEKNDG
tara:strand:+ start:982 stop:2205 length:1224 start_codon:yes stop_codon:yes gene_type:complete